MTNSTSKSKIPLAAILFAIALLPATLVRLAQYSRVIEPASGFFVYNAGFLSDAYYILIVAAAAALGTLAVFDEKAKRGIISSGVKNSKKNKSNNKISKKKVRVPKVSPVSSVFGAVLLSACGFLVCLEAVNAFSGNLSPVRIVLPALAALGYTFAAYKVFTDKKLLPLISIAFLFISAYHVGIATVEFMTRIYTVNLSARLIFMAMNLLIAMFYLSSGRIIVRSEGPLTTFSVAVCGYTAALLLFSDALARIFHYFAADAETQSLLIHNNNGFELPDPISIIQGIAVLWVIFAMSYKAKQELTGASGSAGRQGELDVGAKQELTGANGSVAVNIERVESVETVESNENNESNEIIENDEIAETKTD